MTNYENTTNGVTEKLRRDGIPEEQIPEILELMGMGSHGIPVPEVSHRNIEPEIGR